MRGAWSGWTDGDLITAIQRGERGAFDALVERYARTLARYFWRCSGDREVAEDCVQEVFLRLHAHLAGYEPQAKFTTFLFRIARNLWIDRVRSVATHGRTVSLQGPMGRDDSTTLQGRIASDSPGPVEILARQESEEALKRAIDHLPQEQRSVVLLGELQGMKYQDIGALLDIPVGTVKSRMHAAIEKLKGMLAFA